jgi:tetratricopeptide (TPR) repeat protein
MASASVIRTELERIQTCLKLGDHARAAALGEALLERAPGQTQLHALLGRLALHAGDPARAARHLKLAAAHAPQQADLHADLAAALADSGDHDDAEAAAQTALELDPGLVSALNVLGNMLSARGQHERALETFARALSREPRIALLHANRAAALRRAGRLEDALHALTQALELAPGEPALRTQQVALLQECGRAHDALPLALQLAQSQPQSASAFQSLARVLADCAEHAAADAAWRQAIALAPQDAALHYEFGCWAHTQTRFEDAREHAGAAARLAPQWFEPHVRAAQACLELGAAHEALAHAEQALVLQPRQVDALQVMGQALRALARPEEAILAWRAAAEQAPGRIETWCNLAAAELDMGSLTQAETFAQEALARDPSCAEAMWSLAHVRLTRNELANGWDAYESRLCRASACELVHPYPYWDGAPLAGKILFVTAEQGVGDELQFASCVPDAIAAAAKVVLECDARLIAMFRRAFPQAHVIARLARAQAYPADAPTPDAQIAIGSLPRVFRRSEAAFPARGAYIAADPARVQEWRERLDALGPGRKVGIAWRGGKEVLVQRARSIALERWAVLAGLPDVQWICLQYGDRADDIARARSAGLAVHDWADADPLRDLEGHAAQIAALDAVISIDNATVHMAGALGVPTWVLLPYVSDWRWQQEREDSPWYPSLRLFRQPSAGAWDDVFAHVRAAWSQAHVGAPGH